MQVKIATPNTVTYNSATNSFEALVIIHTTSGDFRYPCSIEGSLVMPFSTAAFKLTQQAKQRHLAHDDLRARRVNPKAQAMPSGSTARFGDHMAWPRAA